MAQGGPALDIRHLAYDQTDGQGPGVVFLGGFNSTRNGNKAIYLENWAKSKGRAFLRFDYSGHGDSLGAFEDGTIGTWARDAAAIIDGLTKGPQILIGSSMGGWIALLLAKRMPARVAGLVTIAAAPDFTEDKYASGLTEKQKQQLAAEGQIEIPSAYDDGPYIITQRLVDDGRAHLILRSPLVLPMPTRLLHGTDDDAVPQATAHRLFDHARGDDIQLRLVKGADHRFSTASCLRIISDTIDELSDKLRTVSGAGQPATS